MLHPVTKKQFQITILLTTGITLLLLLYVGIATRGTFNLFPRSDPGLNYADWWIRLTQLRLDIDPDKIHEHYYRNGKVFTYFGMFPALVRGALGGIGFSLSRTDLTLVSSVLALLLLISCSISISLHLGLWQTLTVPGRAAVAALIFLGNPALLLIAPLALYHEAILWGAAWASLFLACSVFLLTRRTYSFRLLALMGTTAGLSLLSRSSIGLVTAFSCLSVLATLTYRRYFRPQDEFSNRMGGAALLGGFLALSLLVIFWGWINYQRFGNPLESMPMTAYRYSRSPGNADFPGNKKFLADRIPAGLDYYFLPRSTNFKSEWPYLDFRCGGYFNASRFHYIDCALPLPLISPALFFFALVGAFSLFKKGRHEESKSDLDRRLLLTLVGSSSLILPGLMAFHSLSLRYTLDFIPLFILLSMLGIRSFGSRRNRQWILVALVIISLGTLFSTIHLNNYRLIIKLGAHGLIYRA